MSADWWNRKLGGGYVYHEGQFKYVESLHAPSSRQGAHELWPEDSQKGLQLVLGDGNRIEISAAQFISPADSWKLVTNQKGTHACYASRDVTRKRWRIVPGPDSYKRSSAGVSLQEWLNAPSPTLVDRAEVSKWRDDQPQFYSSQLMSEQITPFSRVIRWATQPVLQLNRTPETQELVGLRRNIPDVLKTGWGFDLNIPVPYTRMSKANRDLFKATPPVTGPDLTYDWEDVGNRDNATDDFQYWWEDTPRLRTTGMEIASSIRVRVNGDTWTFHPENADDVDNYFESDEEIAEDIRQLLSIGGAA